MVHDSTSRIWMVQPSQHKNRSAFFGRFWQSYPWLGSADVAALFAGDLRGGQKEHDLSEMVASGYSCWVVEWA